MPFHFYQETSMRKLGFANLVLLEVSPPIPKPAEFEGVEDSEGKVGYGLTLLEFDEHPYLAASGFGNLDGSMYDEQAVDTCISLVIKHHDGYTEVGHLKDYTESPSFWNIFNEPDTFEMDVGYNTTMWAAWSLDRAVWQYVRLLDENGVEHEYRNVAALPDDERYEASFRMWGKTRSWGSEDARNLFLPWRDVR